MQRIRKKGKPVVTCDKCGRIISNIKPKTRKQGEIEYYYLKCRRCGGVFVISATDEALRQDIKRFEEMTKKTEGRLSTEKETQEAQALLKANVARSREIKEQHPLKLRPWEN